VSRYPVQGVLPICLKGFTISEKSTTMLALRRPKFIIVLCLLSGWLPVIVTDKSAVRLTNDVNTLNFSPLQLPYWCIDLDTAVTQHWGKVKGKVVSVLS
jgi:hypothetical protein